MLLSAALGAGSRSMPIGSLGSSVRGRLSSMAACAETRSATSKLHSKPASCMPRRAAVRRLAPHRVALDRGLLRCSTRSATSSRAGLGLRLAYGWSMRALCCAWYQVGLRRTRRALGCGSLALLVNLSLGCASGMNDKQSGEPCTRTDQCAAGLFCSGGSCRPSPRRGSAGDAQSFEEDAGLSAVSK